MSATQLSRRHVLAALPLLVAASATPVLAVVPEHPADAWVKLMESLADIAPADAPIRLFGSRDYCRVEIMRTFDEPVHPKLPGRTMAVERTIGSYRWSENGWVSEGLFE